MDKPAIKGGRPVREKLLPYGHQWITNDDILRVVNVLKSDWITQGPAIDEFEKNFKQKIGCKNAVAISSGTAALHLAMLGLGIKRGDEVITTPLTFAATANAALYCGAKPVFADIDKETMNVSPNEIKKKITKKTKAIAPVHFTGLPCDLTEIYEIAEKHGLRVVEDAAHALGAKYRGNTIGSKSDVATFSFHPVKHITTGEGGIVATHDDKLAESVRALRTHGIVRDPKYSAEKPWFYEMKWLGFNYRITDIQASLGSSQLKRLDSLVNRRNEIAEKYDTFFKELPEIIRPATGKEVLHARHIYVIRLAAEKLSVGRDEIFRALRAENIGVNVHYIPVYWHAYYQQLGYKKGLCPKAEAAFETMITLPLFPKMSDTDAQDVMNAVEKVVAHYKN